MKNNRVAPEEAFSFKPKEGDEIEPFLGPRSSSVPERNEVERARRERKQKKKDKKKKKSRKKHRHSLDVEESGDYLKPLQRHLSPSSRLSDSSNASPLPSPQHNPTSPHPMAPLPSYVPSPSAATAHPQAGRRQRPPATAGLQRRGDRKEAEETEEEETEDEARSLVKTFFFEKDEFQPTENDKLIRRLSSRAKLHFSDVCSVMSEPQRNKRLMDAIQAGTPLDLTYIFEFKGSWNFMDVIGQRANPVSPLSVLCRPELAGALPGVSVEGQQRLIKHAIGRGANPWYESDGSGARAITDTVYQGRVDILKLMLELKYKDKHVVSKQGLEEYRYVKPGRGGGQPSASTLLHMACYDSRFEMIKFLVVEIGIDPNIEATGGFDGQTPLFWVFARGPVRIECAYFFLEQNVDPFKPVQFTRKNDSIKASKRSVHHNKKNETVYVSPFSLAIRTFPDFALKCLEKRREVLSNRGLNATVRYDWRDILVKNEEDTEGNPHLITPVFALQLDASEVEKKKKISCLARFRACYTCGRKNPDGILNPGKRGGWETWKYDDDPNHMHTLVEMMIMFKRKELLTNKLIRKAVMGMWDTHARAFYYLQVALFFVYALLITVATSTWPRRLCVVEHARNRLLGDEVNDAFARDDVLAMADDPLCFTAEGRDEIVLDFVAPNSVVYCLIAAMALSFFFLWIEVVEVKAAYGSLPTKIRHYLMDFWNLVDLMLNGSVWMLGAATLWVATAETWVDYINCDNAFVVTTIVMHMSITVKFLQFLAVSLRTGHMVSIIWQMMRDIITFCILWFVIFEGFAQALWSLWKNAVSPDATEDGVALAYNFEEAYSHMFQWMLGDGLGDLPPTLKYLESKWEHILLLILFYAWIVLAAIMLINMLIAMMGNTYETVAGDEFGEHILNWTVRVNELWLTANKTTKQEFLQELNEVSGKQLDEKQEKNAKGELGTMGEVAKHRALLDRLQRIEDMLVAKNETKTSNTRSMKDGMKRLMKQLEPAKLAKNIAGQINRGDTAQHVHVPIGMSDSMGLQSLINADPSCGSMERVGADVREGVQKSVESEGPKSVCYHHVNLL